MLTDSAENITPPQTNIFEHNVFSPQSSPSAQHQPVSMMPTEHLATAGNILCIQLNFKASFNVDLVATENLKLFC